MVQYRKVVSHIKYNARMVSFAIGVHAAEGADKSGFFVSSEF